MTETASHHWIRGALRADRARFADTLALPPMLLPTIDAHRRLRGPYTAAGAVLRALVPEAQHRVPELVTRHDIELLSVAPELRADIPATRETLTSLAVPDERTRYYSKLRTNRMAHGIHEFLRDLLGDLPGGRGPRTLLVENVEHADHTDAELLAVLLRRMDPNLLTIVVCAGSGELPETPLVDVLHRYARNHDLVTGAARGLSVESAQRLAARYVDSDATADEPDLLAAYEAVDGSERARLHDRRAEELESSQDFSLRLGAIPYHRTHGSDRAGAGASALQLAIDHCSVMGFYHATVEFSLLAREIVGWDNPRQRYLITSRMTTALAVLERPVEAEALYDESRLNSSLPVIHMGAAYATGMLYTRHHEPELRDDRRAKALVNQAIAFASMFPNPKERAFQGVFMRNGLALVEVHLGNLPEALRLVDEGLAELAEALGPDEHQLHRSVLRFNRGQVCAGLGLFEEAAADYAAVIAVDPNYAEYHFEHGNMLRRLGRDEEALADYEMVMRLSPPFYEAYYNRGDIRASAGDRAGALADFSYVLELEPTFVDARINRAGIYLDEGDLASAYQDAVAGLRHEPDNPHLHLVLSRIHAENENWPAAYDACDRALHADPDEVNALSGRGSAAYELDRLDVAVQDLCRAVELAPEDPALRYNRAFLYQKIGRWSEALADLNTAAEMAPEDQDVLDAIAECRGHVVPA